jgi:hypothetical protein
MNITNKLKDHEEIVFLIHEVRHDPIKENKENLFQAIKDYNKKYKEKFNYTKTG